MSVAGKKIPDMFLRALKRKSDVMADATNVAVSPKRPLSDQKSPAVLEEPRRVEADPKIEEMSREEEKLRLFDLLRSTSWQDLLRDEFQKPYMQKIESYLDKELKKAVQIFPPRDEIFSAFNLTDLAAIRVVIIGQDPYHNDGQAHGLSFSVKNGVKPPPSLKNIYKELKEDFPGSFDAPEHGYLLGWARQGVFMLNATLTVEAHKANSHAKIGWQTFTDHVIRLISRQADHVVFLLWGGFAHKKSDLIDAEKHAVIKTAHPSPLSARHWFGCRCFSKANEHLQRFGLEQIDWNDLKTAYP